MKHLPGFLEYFTDAPVCSNERNGGTCGPGWLPLRETLATKICMKKRVVAGNLKKKKKETLATKICRWVVLLHSVPSRLGLMGVHLKGRLHEMDHFSQFWDGLSVCLGDTLMFNI